MGSKNNIERNKIDYILTDIMPVETSELFSFGKFYEYLSEHHKELNGILEELLKLKARNVYMFNGGIWASTPLKYNILKGVNGAREINIVQPSSALNIYFFIECYQKEILDYLENNNRFSLRYHRKNNDLYYRCKSQKLTEYFSKTSRKVNKSIIQQTGAYFKIHKFNSVSSFTNSRLWQQCNFKYRYFAKVDYKACFDSIYTHTYKWIIERNTVDSKDAKNSNMLIVIDRILQNINGRSSNGLIVGPEFSRMIAEILLQSIDKGVFEDLQLEGLIMKKDYRVFRYVDDIYIFANNSNDIDRIVKTIEKNAQKYLLRLNELKYFTTETPVLLNKWIEKTRILADKIAALFHNKKDLRDNDECDYLVKNGYISLERLKDEFAILMVDYPNDRRYIVSFILSTLLNNISNKKDGYKLFDTNKTGRAYILLELAFFVYSFCPCFEHSQKIISMIVYFDDELKFKDDENNHNKLVNLIRRYAFIFEKANLNDICNWFIFFNEYNISLLKNSEDVIYNRIIQENNPILWANYLIYSRYNLKYNGEVLNKLEEVISNNIMQMVADETLLQKEFWYVLIFVNCPYISTSLKIKLKEKVNLIPHLGNDVETKSGKLIYDFISTNHLNLFFYWGYYNFDACKQLTFRTYQRTLFKQYKNKRTVELYGSLDS
ncbi:RNA-directed DNA polymerase [Ruminococcus albus]|uniref:Reverse transcriptase (RNA-dependent DNA polymerase) n=1 Tax=Ruminococcus albus TaxID=1264 RepID=A0A1H7PD63_RUMAL|nr:RNA-directed DNA polymerase [Ruminococcus albus]SEL33354.1 Reverse transcriptase (RNA-dependent DNA polymerase) [Ruminococcus albus]